MKRLKSTGATAPLNNPPLLILHQVFWGKVLFKLMVEKKTEKTPPELFRFPTGCLVSFSFTPVSSRCLVSSFQTSRESKEWAITTVEKSRRKWAISSWKCLGSIRSADEEFQNEWFLRSERDRGQISCQTLYFSLSFLIRSQVTKWLGNQASNQKVGSIPRPCQMMLCPPHPTCLGGMSLYLL